MNKSYKINYRINNMKYRILFLFFEIQILRNILAILNDFNA